VAVGKELEDRVRVIADGGQLEALLFKSCGGVLQLDQLLFAEGSPIGGAEEKQDRTLGAAQRFECLQLSELVGDGEIGGFLPDRQA
jgi:hypothetical protein